ncbi:hypothetical protein [Methylobacterium sp. E-066]|uniref:hypothetical protein n=1 Tax=Methylobacterium sp. E-066 TaxID=2836584 RepID=UPI001FBA305C|nr:hypothetical protein [Methylobacterium sp. E-066]MCJ2140423.1 hypothetical protein [Methylobacterium sp. E-066]
MAAIDEAFWVDLDAHIIANRSKDLAAPSSGVFNLSPLINASAPSGAPPTSPRQVASDWTGVLDTITAAKSAADRQENRLREQAAAYEALIQELKLAQNKIKDLEVLANEVREQTEKKQHEIMAGAERLRQEIQAKADAQLQTAEDRIRAAELRASVAEDWLRRIEQASKNLLPGERRAAA